MYTYMYVYVCLCMYMYVYVCMYLCIYIAIYILTYVCSCVLSLLLYFITVYFIIEIFSYLLLLSYVSWMWCDKGNRIIINKYWPGFSDEKDTLRIHNLFYLVFLLSHWMNWLNITFPCLGFSIDVWRGASLIYSVEKKKVSGEGRKTVS